ncbi:hypothetical protein AGRA3207_005575 [Actinomadura graeca]|uniref:Uncharacterized protein n=1 Tax=Actinomadura graeca TaxID=2750812 RepID=A0ABX8QZR5_9ACTN|nr:hypothetical protein [Actinomadura graeca]QXJ24285.1 hypothetical protein AGRA3207_005575 [Actinomadura graeca]
MRGNPAERVALSALCDELPALREQCAAEPEDKRLLLTRIEAEARARRPILALLGELLGTGAEDTGAVRGLGAGLPGAGPGRADEERFGCPDGACDRTAVAVPAGPVPHCVLTGLPMSGR